DNADLNTSHRISLSSSQLTGLVSAAARLASTYGVSANEWLSVDNTTGDNYLNYLYVPDSHWTRLPATTPSVV
ncbi:MAG: hypothetical protein LUQ07_02620, partial [Methanospirillum sp.]|nr:hypothetical protein [Methanospirillum sp.]